MSEKLAPAEALEVLEEILVEEDNNKKNHYVDNEKFQEEMVKYKEAVIHAKLNGLPNPRVSEAIGENILKIATHLAYRGNFIAYPFKEEMIGDGIENALKYINNYDHMKYFKPFAYFNFIIWRSFLRRIKKEKKHLLKKARYIQNIGILADVINEVQEHDEEAKHFNQYIDYLQNYYDANTEEEPKKKDKKKK